MSPAVPPVGAAQLLLFLIQLGALLLAAVALGRLSERFGQPRLVGELMAGVLLGPTVLGNLAPALSAAILPRDPDQMHLLDVVAQLGVLLLVALTGAHLDTAVFRRRGLASAGVSLGGLLLPLALGVVTGLLLPDELVPAGVDPVVVALFMGVAMCVTAIPVVARMLADLDLLHRTVGQLTIAAAVVDDTVGWLLLAVVAALAAGGVSGALPTALVVLVALLALTVPVSRWSARLLGPGGRCPDAGTTTALAVVVVLAFSAVSAAGGLEPLFGAFLAGVAVLRHIDPAKLAGLHTVVTWVLAPIFLATIGLRIDLTLLARPVVLGAAATVLTVAVLGKFVGVYAGARLSRLSRPEAVAMGIGMNTRGMVEVVVALVGLRLGVLTDATFTVVILLAIVTSVGVPPLLRAAMRRVPVAAEETARRRVPHPV